jgi:hypothetical protein
VLRPRLSSLRARWGHRQRLGVVGLRTKEFDAELDAVAELGSGADEGAATPAAGKTGEFGGGAELTGVGSSTSLIRSSDRRGRIGGAIGAIAWAPAGTNGGGGVIGAIGRAPAGTNGGGGAWCLGGEENAANPHTGRLGLIPTFH